MTLKDKLRAELIDIVEWIDDTERTLVWRYPRHQNEIKHGAQLIVRPGQLAVLVNQGEIADAFDPGQYSLKTKNLPILSTLRGWKHGFESPFKAEVYFVSTRQITDLKWGTPQPIALRDADFGPVRVRAFGNFTLKATHPETLLKELVGTDREFSADKLDELLRSVIVSSFADMIGESKIAVLDLAARYSELSEGLRQSVRKRLSEGYGLDIPTLVIVNVSVPKEVEQALDARSSMGILGNMQQFQQYQMGKAVVDAAQNPTGGGAGQGVGLGVGFAMAGQMAQGLGGPGAPPPAPPAAAGAPQPPPPPQAGPMFHIAINGASKGPFSLEQLAGAAAQGQLLPTTQVWSPALGGWKPASEVAALAHLFAPPPPPGASQ